MIKSITVIKVIAIITIIAIITGTTIIAGIPSITTVTIMTIITYLTSIAFITNIKITIIIVIVIAAMRAMFPVLVMRACVAFSFDSRRTPPIFQIARPFDTLLTDESPRIPFEQPKVDPRNPVAKPMHPA